MPKLKFKEAKNVDETASMEYIRRKLTPPPPPPPRPPAEDHIELIAHCLRNISVGYINPVARTSIIEIVGHSKDIDDFCSELKAMIKAMNYDELVKEFPGAILEKSHLERLLRCACPEK